MYTLLPEELLDLTIDGVAKRGSGVRFSRISNHEEENYPGDVLIEVSYIVTLDDELYITSKAELL